MPSDNISIESVDDKMKSLAKGIVRELPKNTGFALLIFDFNNTNGRLDYVSNANRNDIVNVMKEFIEKVTNETFGKHI